MFDNRITIYKFTYLFHVVPSKYDKTDFYTIMLIKYSFPIFINIRLVWVFGSKT